MPVVLRTWYKGPISFLAEADFLAPLQYQMGTVVFRIEPLLPKLIYA